MSAARPSARGRRCPGSDSSVLDLRTGRDHRRTKWSVRTGGFGQQNGMSGFNGLGLHLGNLSRLSSAQTRSISPENMSGEKGKGAMALEGTGARAARELGRGWKVSPSVEIESGETRVI